MTIAYALLKRKISFLDICIGDLFSMDYNILASCMLKNPFVDEMIM